VIALLSVAIVAAAAWVAWVLTPLEPVGTPELADNELLRSVRRSES
jgi:hypothetical protein